ncbi:MAG: hypothetical protein MUF63_06810, partial [Rhodobacteraceae bacterium]|nr:hypothetical protein [Paracoccaceae bacterium]
DTRITPIFDTSDLHTFPHPASCFDECCILVNLQRTRCGHSSKMATGPGLYGLCVTVPGHRRNGRESARRAPTLKE